MPKPTYDVTFRPTQPDQDHLDTYDHTKLSAINTCPTFGILRYQMHKRMPASGRAMALEAGSAMHEVFAFVRLITLMQALDETHEEQFVSTVWNFHGARLFGAERLALIKDVIRDATDAVDVCKRGAIAVLDTGTFYDEPRDKRRTLSNLEECCYAYINRWRWTDLVWMRDLRDPCSDVGIEIPFDIVVSITGDDILQFRLTGRIDGIHWNAKRNLVVHDNKTASRLGEAWSMAQSMSHQYTGYCIAASVFTQHVVNDCDVLGLAIPLPKTYDLGGYIREPVFRAVHHYQRWISWLVHTVRMTQQYKDDPFGAPKYTHSCNRYFRPCSMIPFCYADDAEQHTILEEMETNEWSPLNKEILDGIGSE